LPPSLSAPGCLDIDSKCTIPFFRCFFPGGIIEAYSEAGENFPAQKPPAQYMSKTVGWFSGSTICKTAMNLPQEDSSLFYFYIDKENN